MAYGQEPDRATTFSITRSRSFMKGTHAVILRCSVFLDKVPAPTRPLITPQKSVTHEEAMEDSVQCRVLQEVGNDQPVMGDGPRTISGKCPTAASLQLQREYLDWSAVPPSRDDVVKDYDAFMAERRETAERERLQQREQRRKEARHARGLLRKPAGQGARYGRPGPRTREKPQQRGGRNTNPSSKRQLGLAAQRQRAADRVVAGRQRPAQRKEYFERVKAEKAMFDVKVGEDALLHAQNKMRDLLDSLQEHLRHYRPADHHTAEYHFWQAAATGRFVSTRWERGGATVAERYASQARTLWALAKAAVAAAAAAFAARASAIEEPLLTTCQERDAAEQHALRAHAVTLAAEAAARIAGVRAGSVRIAIEKMTDADFEMHTNFQELTELDQPWVVGAFEAVGISVLQHAEHALDADTPSAPVCVPPIPNLLSGHVHQLNRL